MVSRMIGYRFDICRGTSQFAVDAYLVGIVGRTLRDPLRGRRLLGEAENLRLDRSD